MAQRVARIAVLTGLVLGAIVAVPVAGEMMPQPQEVGAASPLMGSAVDDLSLVLARRICERVRTLQPDSDPTRFEAEMVYALSQGGNDVATQIAALRRVGTLCPAAGAMQVALANATASINNGGTAGTAATAASLGQGSMDSGSAFSSPAVDLGGGSVNYSR